VALTVRPDDEVYQFDTVWLGPDEYTLPIQARYVAWGTWLACFLATAAILIPLGGGGPSGVLGSLVWSLALSVVLSRAVMLVVDHERPLRSLPAMFSAEARAALGARRRGERALLVKPGRIQVRPMPARALAINEQRRRREERRAGSRRPAAPVVPSPTPLPELPPAEKSPLRPEWTPDLALVEDDGGQVGQPEPSGSVATAQDGDAADTVAAVPLVAAAVAEAAQRPPRNDERPATPPAERPGNADEPGERPDEPRPYAGPVTVAPQARRPSRDQRSAPRQPRDRQAALEARILLPARKDR
jgi:hypothetical protein